MITSQSCFNTFTVLCWAPRNEMSSIGSTRNRSRFPVFLHIVDASKSRRTLRNTSVFFFFSVTCTEKTNVLTNGNVTFWNCTDGLIHIHMTCLKSVTGSGDETSRICCEFYVQTPSYRSTKRPGNASLKFQLGLNYIRQSLLWDVIQQHDHTFVQYTATWYEFHAKLLKTCPEL